jgi:hypothetical protein
MDSQNGADPKPNCLGISLDLIWAIGVSNLAPLSFFGETLSRCVNKSLTQVSYMVLQDQSWLFFFRSMCVQTIRGQKRASNPPELELQGGCGPRMWMQGNKPAPPTRGGGCGAANALGWAISPGGVFKLCRNWTWLKAQEISSPRPLSHRLRRIVPSSRGVQKCFPCSQDQCVNSQGTLPLGILYTKCEF